eukprot:scaffold682695_cov57-Prasinocladus_malaysianus.AAC.1
MSYHQQQQQVLSVIDFFVCIIIKFPDKCLGRLKGYCQMISEGLDFLILINSKKAVIKATIAKVSRSARYKEMHAFNGHERPNEQMNE